jgi:hypothetical protein
MDKSSTILIREETRDRLKNVARKDQTYDDIINCLIDRLEKLYIGYTQKFAENKNIQDLLDRRSGTLQSSESRRSQT